MTNNELKRLYMRHSHLKYPDLIRKSISIEQEYANRFKKDNLKQACIHRKKFLLNYRKNIRDKIDKLYNEHSSLYKAIEGFSGTYTIGEMIHAYYQELNSINLELKQLNYKYKLIRTLSEFEVIE